MDSDVIALLVIAGLVVAFAIGLTLFYSAFQRLPHWVQNLLSLPPVFSLELTDAKTQQVHSSVTPHLIALTIGPLLLCIALEVTLLTKTPVWDIADAEAAADAAHCAREAVREQSLHSVVLSVRTGTVPLADITALEAQRPVTTAACGHMAAAELAAARAATNFEDALTGYNAGHVVMAHDLLVLIDKNLDDEDRGQLAEAAGFFTAGYATTDCFAFLHAVVLHKELDVWAVLRFDAVRKVLSSILDFVSHGREEYAHGAAGVLEYPVPVQETARVMLRGLPGSVVWYGVQAVEGFNPRHVSGNATLFITGLHASAAAAGRKALKEADEDVSSDNLHVVLMAVGLSLAAVCILVNAAVIVQHRYKIGWEVRVRKDFEETTENKNRIEALITKIKTLQIEGIRDTDSQVEACFTTLASNVSRLKPFVSHSLFEGAISDTADEATFSRGRTAIFPIRAKVGMHFTSCAALAVGSRQFDDVHKEDMTERAEDVCADYSTFIDIVLTESSRLGGVVHNVGAGAIVCTWNVSVTCQQPTDRAVQCAFNVERSFEYLNSKDDGFCFIPDEMLSMAVCSGDVMSGLIKALPRRVLTIGSAPLNAERMTGMCAIHGKSLIVDHDTHQCVQDRFYTRPIMFVGGQVVYEAANRPPPGKEERSKDYTEAFALLRKGKEADAIQCLKAHLSKDKFQNDQSAKFVLEVLKAKQQKTRGEDKP